MTDGGAKLGANCWGQYTDWPALREAGIRADRLGYDSLWTWVLDKPGPFAIRSDRTRADRGPGREPRSWSHSDLSLIHISEPTRPY